MAIIKWDTFTPFPQDTTDLTTATKMKIKAFQCLYDTLHGRPLPDICLYTVIGCLFKIYDWKPLGWERDRRISGITEATNTLVFEWVTLPRSVAEMRTLLHRPCRCSGLTSADSEFHALGKERCSEPKDPTPRLPSYRIKWLFHPLTYLWLPPGSHPPAWVTDPRALTHKLQSTSLWPHSITRLLPHGPEDTTRGLLNWCLLDSRDPGTTVALASSISAFITACHPYVLPYLVTSRVLLEHGFIKNLRELNSVLTNFTGPSRRNEENVDGVALELSQLSSILFRCVDAYMSRAQLRQFLSGGDNAAMLLRVCESSIHTLSVFLIQSAKVKSCRALLKDLATVLYAEVPQLRNEPSIMSSVRYEVQRAAWPRIYPGTAVMVHFLKNLIRLHYRQRCCNPGCAWTSADAKLRYCASCRRVQYCSLKCQKDAWVFSAAPHREVCGSIGLLCFVYSLPRGANTSERAAKKCTDRASAFKNEHHASLANVLNEHFEQWAKIEMNISRE